jgi:hypothetical protein
MALTKSTVLILGAGASMPYGFPSGDQLKELIISSLESFPKRAGPGTKLENLMHESGIDPDHIEEFRDELAGAHHITIDRFLQNRPNFERVGKLTIAATLIPFESDSIIPMLKPWKARPDAKDRTVEGWYAYLARQLNLSSTNWGRGLLTIVTYNYDRSLEHYLFTILKSTCDKSPEECWKIFQGIPIIHMYGVLGQYNPIGDGLLYGSPLELATSREAAKNIRIMHEAENEGFVNQSKTAGQNAEVVCFLGFGYHHENISSLSVQSGIKGKRIMGTAYGLTEFEQRRLNIGAYVDDARDCTILELLKQSDVLG